MPGRKINKDLLSTFLHANEDYSQKIRSIHICKVKLPRSVREDTALSVIVHLVKMFASPGNHFQNDSFKALFLRSGTVNRMF